MLWKFPRKSSEGKKKKKKKPYGSLQRHMLCSTLFSSHPTRCLVASLVFAFSVPRLPRSPLPSRGAEPKARSRQDIYGRAPIVPEGPFQRTIQLFTDSIHFLDIQIYSLIT